MRDNKENWKFSLLSLIKRKRRFFFYERISRSLILCDEGLERELKRRPGSLVIGSGTLELAGIAFFWAELWARGALAGCGDFPFRERDLDMLFSIA